MTVITCAHYDESYIRELRCRVERVHGKSAHNVDGSHPPWDRDGDKLDSDEADAAEVEAVLAGLSKRRAPKPGKFFIDIPPLKKARYDDGIAIKAEDRGPSEGRVEDEAGSGSEDDEPLYWTYKRRLGESRCCYSRRPFINVFLGSPEY